jgi:hypothetical protein
MDYSIKRLSRELMNDLYWLFKASANTNATLDEFYLKYDTEYTGVSYIGYLAYAEDNSPAAFYGVIPMLALIDNTPVLIAQSADTLTHPDHQRKGLFVRLAQMTYELAKAEGINFIFGFPNENSYPGFVNKLKWSHPCNLQKFEFKVPMLPFSHLFRNNRYLRSVYQAWVSFILIFFKKEKSGFPNPNVSELNYGIYRNEDYFKYKKYSIKHAIKIKSAKAWLRFDGSLKIGDIWLKDYQELGSIIKRLKVIAFFTGVQKIQYQCSPESACFPVFSKLTAPTQALPIIFLNLNEIYKPEKLVFSFADADTF